jgi:flagellar hook-associated protein 2
MKMRSISYGTVDWYSEDKPKYSSFSQIGIINGDAGKTYENTLKGHLSVDESTLKAKLKENPIDVWNIISEEKEVVVGYDSTNKPIYAKNSGVVTQVKDYIWQVTKYSGTIDQISGTNGTIGKEMNRIAKWLVNAINKLQKKEADLYQTFSKMEQAVSKMSIQGSYLLSKLGNNSSNSNQ